MERKSMEFSDFEFKSFGFESKRVAFKTPKKPKKRKERISEATKRELLYSHIVPRDAILPCSICGGALDMKTFDVEVALGPPEWSIEDRMRPVHAKCASVYDYQQFLGDHMIIDNRATIPLPLRERLLRKFIRPRDAYIPCVACGEKITNILQYEAGHIVAESNGGSVELSNLRPIHRSCNASMRSTNLYVFRDQLEKLQESGFEGFEIENAKIIQ